MRFFGNLWRRSIKIEVRSHFEPNFVDALAAIATLSVLVGVLWWNACDLDMVDEKRKLAEDELSNYARRLAIPNRADRVLTSSLDIREVHDRFAEELNGLAPIDRTAIVLLDETREHWTVAMIWSKYEPIIGKVERRAVKGSVIEWLLAHSTRGAPIRAFAGCSALPESGAKQHRPDESAGAGEAFCGPCRKAEVIVGDLPECQADRLCSSASSSA